MIQVQLVDKDGVILTHEPFPVTDDTAVVVARDTRVSLEERHFVYSSHHTNRLRRRSGNKKGLVCFIELTVAYVPQEQHAAITHATDTKLEA